LSLSKAKDASYSSGSPSYWRKYLTSGSKYIFGGSGPSGIVTTGISTGFELSSDISWDQDAQDIIFGSCGQKDFVLIGGKNYDNNSNITTT
jgi:hypothetical protein